MREPQHREVLVELAQPARIVDEQRLAARVIEDPGRVQIRDVDRRILAHQHDVEVGEPLRATLASIWNASAGVAPA